MDDRKVRGSIINSYLSFIERKWGTFGKEKCLKDLKINGKIKDGFYYPNTIKLDILNWIKDKKGEGYIVEAGKYLVKNLRTLSWLVRHETPIDIAKKIEKEYDEIYTFGELRIKGNSGNIKVILKKQKDDDLTCLAYKGILEGILEKTDNIGSVEIKSCLDDLCEFEVNY